MSSSAYTLGHSKSVLSSHSSRTVENAAQFVIPFIKPDSSILDVGCGPGTITSGFAKLAPQGKVIGTDLSPSVIDHARSSFPPDNQPNLSFAPGNILDGLPYPDESFDVIFTSQVIIHLPDPVRGIREMRRLLRPGGVLAMRETAAMYWYPLLPGLALFESGMAVLLGEGSHGGMKLKEQAIAAGFDKAQIKCAGNGTVYATDEERAWWAEGYGGRLDGEVGQRFKKMELEWPEALGGGRRVVGEEGLEVMRRDLKRWVEDDAAWWGAFQSEVLCFK